MRDNHIIVIDGADGVGKSTQIKLLKDKYSFFNFMKFPNYNSHTGFYIEKYLNNELDHLFPYSNLSEDIIDMVWKISTLYTMDRLYWFNIEYDDNVPLICDRYTTSNMIHMGAMMLYNKCTESEIIKYIDDLSDLEYNKFKIPKPNMMIYLDAPSDILLKNLNNNREKLDRHECEQMLQAIDESKKILFNHMDWVVIDCFNGEEFRSIEDINKEIISYISGYLYEVR